MNAPKHSPGPWKDEGGSTQRAITGPDGNAVAFVPPSHALAAENARLIAKAPELLELVRGVVGLERRKLLKDKGARAWVGACEALLAELGELPARAEVEES